MIQLHEDEKESMNVLRGLALEIQDMDELQRLKTLKWVVQKETRGEGNRFWLIIVKILLVRPDLIPQALKLTQEELKMPANTLYLKLNVQQVADNHTTPRSKKLLGSFFNLFFEN